MTRDQKLLARLVKAEEEVWRLATTVEVMAGRAAAEDADGHAELYEEVAAVLRCAHGDISQAVVAFTDGNDELGVPPVPEVKR